MPFQSKPSTVEKNAYSQINERPVYRPELDALRFFAFFAVFLHHSFLVSEGLATAHSLRTSILVHLQQAFGFGLSLFFFLSAFLITSLLQLEKERSGTIAFRSFYIRRVLRIWPLYFLVIFSMFGLGYLYPPARFSIGQLLALSLLVGNWYSLFVGPGSPCISSLWSISVEEQFYLLWPWLFRLFSKRGFQIFSVALSLGSLATIAFLARNGSVAVSLWYNSLAQMLYFGAGALLATIIGMRKSKKSLPLALLAIFSGAVLWFYAAGLSHSSSLVVITPAGAVAGYLLDALGCAAILLGFLSLPLWALPRPLIYLGRISYGLYVFHRIVLTVLNSSLGHGDNLSFPLKVTSKLLGFALTVLLASISYQFFEKPFLKLKSRFEVVRTRGA